MEDHIQFEVCLPKSRLLSGLVWMWSFKTITLKVLLSSLLFAFIHWQKKYFDLSIQKLM